MRLFSEISETVAKEESCDVGVFTRGVVSTTFSSSTQKRRDTKAPDQQMIIANIEYY
jgi:hypothetical protein